ncbi:ion transporter [Adhaeribacter aquaticus]|uniref:ion transporter n=1 Tax=Adhaeribacter aquaticus TaxID=299567 RepID=UPI00042559F5|nr:ion transporter [Adhaeribacter aquaticus]
MVNNRSQTSLKEKLYTIIFEAETRAGKLFDVMLIIVILLSILTVLLESVAKLRQDFQQTFVLAEWTFTILFTIEFILRIYSSPKPKKYLTSFFGVVDLLSILPTYISLLVPGSHYFMIIRVLRLLRIARIFKLSHYLHEGQILSNALKASATKIIVFIATVMMLVVIIGALMYVIEGTEHGFTSIPKSIYWAIVTLTTVGYGDIAPQTTLGQFLASVVMLLGYGIIAIPTGIVTVEMANASHPKTTTQVCPNCYKEGHEEKANFCNQCGHRLNP